MILQRWFEHGRSAFGSAKEASGEGVMMQFKAGAGKLQATLTVPGQLTLGSGFINFYFGFNTPDGTPVVEAGVSVSSNKNYGSAPPTPDYAASVVMGQNNTFKDKFNSQAADATQFWNVFVNDCAAHTVCNFPASSDLRGKPLSVLLDMTGKHIAFQVQGMPVPPIPLLKRPLIGIAKMIAATDNAATSSFGPATMTMDRIDGQAPQPGQLYRVNGSNNLQTLTVDGAEPPRPNGFTCQSGALTH